MKTSKINIGLSLSRNFDKVTLEMLDEPIEYENDEEFAQGVRKRFSLLRAEVDREFGEIQK